jgi:hypothetical protein
MQSPVAETTAGRKNDKAVTVTVFSKRNAKMFSPT